MNTFYYFITRKIIRPFFRGIKSLWHSLFYMFLFSVLSTIFSCVFGKYIFFPKPGVIGIIMIICLILLAILLLVRCIGSLAGEYDRSNEPEFIQQFIKDCCRDDNELEMAYKEKRRQQEEVKKKKREAERIEREKIRSRNEILDL